MDPIDPWDALAIIGLAMLTACVCLILGFFLEYIREALGRFHAWRSKPKN